MDICVASCGIFRPELERLMPEIIRELGLEREPEILFVPPALHVDYKKLEGGITEGLKYFDGRNTMLLFGSMCHPKMLELTADFGAPCLAVGNCIDAILSPDEKLALEEKYGRVFFMTSGWFKYWRDIMRAGMGWDTFDARATMGFYDQIVVIDSGACGISDEDLLEIFEFTQIPVDVEPVTLDYFKEMVKELYRGQLSKN